MLPGWVTPQRAAPVNVGEPTQDSAVSMLSRRLTRQTNVGADKTAQRITKREHKLRMTARNNLQPPLIANPIVSPPHR
jgi:hypothetical protein